jgi:hypothetical protein
MGPQSCIRAFRHANWRQFSKLQLFRQAEPFLDSISGLSVIHSTLLDGESSSSNRRILAEGIPVKEPGLRCDSRKSRIQSRRKEGLIRVARQ